MTRVILERLETGNEGTFGRIIAGNLVLFTGELPWRENLSNLSCIPQGLYRCDFTYSPAFRRFLYAVGPVERRAGIRKHPANLMGDRTLGFKSQLNGCIAIGEKLGWISGQKALLLSAPAVRRFETHMELKPFILEIKGV